MKFSLLLAALLLLAGTAVFAGCSGLSPVAPAGNPNASESLSGLLLESSEVPFTVADEKTTSPDLAGPELMMFRASRGVMRVFSSDKTPSATTAQLGQMIIEYPPGNAALAFAKFEDLNRNADQSRYKITWLPDPGIGNQSCALIIADRTGADMPNALIVFEKSTFMESVYMTAPSLDTDALIRSARAAADKIR
jgi:hypothetical protein